MAIKNITTPDLGGADDVTVIEILVKPGDKIAAEAPIVTLESDKATMEIPSSDAGIVKEIKVKVGDKVSTGMNLITLEAAEDKAATENKSAPKPASEPKPVETTGAVLMALDSAANEKPEKAAPKSEAPQEAPKETAEPEKNAEVHAGPGVRRFARELGVNLDQIAGSGPKQRILKEDVQGYVKTQLTQNTNTGFAFLSTPVIDFTKFGTIETQPLSRIKKISGKNLQRNWMMIPHVTQFAEADITTLEEFRNTQKSALEKQKIKLTPLVFIMKAVVGALKAFPSFNASLDASGENLILKKYFHLGVAVDTPDGLVVPVIRDVDKKGLLDLAKELAQLSEKARNKQLTPGEMSGGCFSISSLGGIGGTAFTPIINAPEVAILGVSKAAFKPIYTDGTFVPRLMLPLSLSYDHRVVDGADGARFILYLSNTLADIRNLLL